MVLYVKLSCIVKFIIKIKVKSLRSQLVVVLEFLVST